jgi:hypothetical protein
MYHSVNSLNHPTIASAPNDCPGAGHTAYEELLGAANLPSQLDEGEIWIEYHPASGKHPEISRPQGVVQCVVPPVMPYDTTTPPWHPFRTRADCEQAELFLRYDCTDSYINGQVKLIHSSSPLRHNITLEFAKEMHDGGDFGFVFVDTIIRSVHILPPSTYNHHYTIQDLQSPDMHLRLESMH